MELFKWSTTAANNNASVPDGAPNGWLGANVNEWARETMASARAHASDAAYVDETYNLASVGTKTIVRNSTTQIVVQSCNATSIFTTGRRIRVVGATTDYGYVTSSSFSSPHTTVNVTMESGDVPTTPTAVLAHVDAQIKSGAYSQQGAGNGLNADQVDGYHAADIFGPSIHAEAIVNGSMLVWQRGTSSISAPVSTRTRLADRWYTTPVGASVTVERTTTTPTGAVSPYALKVTGATSVTNVILAAQRIESYLMPYIKTTITISALVKNDTTASMTLSLTLATPSAADDWTSSANRLTQPLASVASGGSARLSHTVDVSGYTNIDNGLEVGFLTSTTSLNSASKSITITEIQIDRSAVFSFFRLRPFPDELLRCQRYYQKTFDYATVPAQNWVGAGSGLPAGAFVIPGSSAGAGSDNAGGSWVLSTVMRAAPTVTTFNPRAANSNAVRIDNSGTATITTTAGTSMVNFAIAASQDRVHCFGATAEAEL